ncbi:MAG: DNA repair protein RecN [Erysipelotrichaceae bacterium]|nr:DNA repair protein RecN [Erysipelotrichaceae bacterium]
MLKSLRIKNYAIIDDLSIDFEDGFNVFTGETGAGKSIIFGALSLLFKGRSDTSLIKHGKDKAIIEGVFSIKDDYIKKLLDEQDIEYDDELIIKRVFSVDNHNSIKVNQSNVTLNFLNELLNPFIDIHSQKDNQLLYVKSYQLLLLDKFSNNSDLLNKYHIAYNNYLSLKKQYEDLKNNTYSEREIEFYKYDLNELEEANIDINEEEELETNEKLFKENEKYAQIYNEAYDLYNKDNGIKEQLYSLLQSINSIDDNLNDKVLSYKNKFEEDYYSLDENISQILLYLKSLNDNDLNIEAIEERLYIYNKLKRKHKCDTNGLITLKEELKAKIEAFEDRDKVLNEKLNEVNKSLETINKIGEELSVSRKNNAKELERLILIETNELLLKNCKFEILVNNVEPNSNGLDDVDFLVCMNKGEELKPLRNIASGGEVSRLMLALKSVFSKISSTDLLILDEIDTGVSGNVANVVGEKIAKISKNTQVLCISHLALVAAYADSHYLIYKEDDNVETTTKVKKLSTDDIIKELASMSSSDNNTKALAAASEIYNKAQKTKSEI